MEEVDRAKIRSIKSKVMAMLKERHSVAESQGVVASPSQYWSSVCSYFDYMLGLSEEYFAKLRVHTYHLSGDTYQTYLYDSEDFRHANNLDALTRGIPSAYVLNEPDGGIGFRYRDGRFVSADSLRFQRIVNTLYRQGILSELSGDRARKCHVLEIGAGYGGLAHQLSNICKNMTYVIVDLPETLLFSASYLSLLNPKKKIYLYDSEDFSRLVESETLASYDFVLLPNYRLHSLSRLRFDLVINIASFQEMRTGQVEEYLDFIQRTCTGFLYSWNQDREPRNEELSNLSSLLKQRFEVTEVSDWQMSRASWNVEGRTRVKLVLKAVVKKIALAVGLLDRPTRDFPYREYVCIPMQVAGKPGNSNSRSEQLPSPVSEA
jgi:putative sugar O-methyltransferase